MSDNDLSLIAMIGDILGQLQMGVFASNLRQEEEFTNEMFREIFGGTVASRKIRIALRAATRRCGNAYLAGADGVAATPQMSPVDIAVDGLRLKVGMSVYGPWVVGAIAQADVIHERSATAFPLASAARHFHLTRRESDVAEHLARGRPNDEIARVLGISIYTSRRHTERVLMKLGVRSRAQVAAVLLGLTDRGRKAG